MPAQSRNDPAAGLFVRRIYLLALVFGAMGSVAYFSLEGWRAAAGFALGAFGSFFNLWMYERIVRSIEPGAAGEPVKKPWQAGVFVGRYVAMISAAYGIVRLLDVKPLAVILGLLTGTAAVLTATLIELFESFFVSRAPH